MSTCVTRDIDLPAGLRDESEVYTPQTFRPTKLTEEYEPTSRFTPGRGGEVYRVYVSGPRLRKDGRDHAKHVGGRNVTDILAGTQYARFVVGRDALAALAQVEVTR